MNTTPKSTNAAPSDDVHLIVVEDEEVVIEHHPEDWFAFVLFWALAFIVFLQFFTRYILNDSLAWTEEIARYGLMSLAFIGGAVVTRKKAHIAVELVSNLMGPGPVPVRVAGAGRFHHARLHGPDGVFLGDDRRADAFAADDRVRPSDEPGLRPRRPRLLHDAGAPDPGGLEQRARRLATGRPTSPIKFTPIESWADRCRS